MSVESINHVHWFLRDKCNNPQRCSYCYGPVATEECPSSENDALLATKITDNQQVERVVLGGGEPTLGDVETVIRLLKRRPVQVSLHTNGLTLTEAALDRWAQLGLDEIALPIDAVDSKIQAQLRGQPFLTVHQQLTEWAKRINNRGIRLRYHTVFTQLNKQEIPKIYDLIKSHPFAGWRIYEFNDDLARDALCDVDRRGSSGPEAFTESEALRNLGTPEKGFSDSLLADFLRTEARIRKLKDARVKFVTRIEEGKETNVFLANSGEVHRYSWYSGSQRSLLGNFFQEDLLVMEQKLASLEADERDDGAWFDALADLPVWARLGEGNYYPEELEVIDPKYLPEVEHLANLWEKRKIKRML